MALVKDTVEEKWLKTAKAVVACSSPDVKKCFSRDFRLGLISGIGKRGANYDLLVITAGVSEATAIGRLLPRVYISQVAEELWTLGRVDFPVEILAIDNTGRRKLPLQAPTMSQAILLAGEEILRGKAICLEKSVPLQLIMGRLSRCPSLISRKFPQVSGVDLETILRLYSFEFVWLKAKRKEPCDLRNLEEFARRLARYCETPKAWLFPEL